MDLKHKEIKFISICNYYSSTNVQKLKYTLILKIQSVHEHFTILALAIGYMYVTVFVVPTFN